jgi:hypothetical protein
MAAYLSPIGNEPQIDSNGDPLVGGKIYTYIATTTTPTDTYTSNTGGTSQANPIILNARGCPANPIWLAAGQSYKFIITDADDVPLPPTLDGITGINDPAFASSVDQWVALGLTPTYISATSFSVAGDQSLVLHARRRVKTTNSGGLSYSTIVSATFAAGVTTVVLTNDSNTLDAGLSAVSYALLSATNISIPPIAPVQNFLHNPDGAIAQRGASSATDDTYSFDRWVVLTQTAAIGTLRLSNAEDGYAYAMRLTQTQAAAQRFGHLQIMESTESAQLRGQAVSFGGRFRASSSLTMRMALLAWTGTADSVTSDVVNDWTSSTYTSGNFFVAANYTVVAVTSAALTTSASNVFVTGTVPSGTTNLVVVYWTEATAAQNVFVDAWGVKTVLGTSLADHIRRHHGEELSLCRRFLPGITGDTGDVAVGVATSTSAGVVDFTYSVEPRIAPTGVSSSGTASLTTGSASSAVTAIAFSTSGKKSCRLSITGTGTPYTANTAVILVLTDGGLLFTGAEL